MDVPKEGIIVHLKDLGQACKDRDADAVGTAFDLRVDAPGPASVSAPYGGSGWFRQSEYPVSVFVP